MELIADTKMAEMSNHTLVDPIEAEKLSMDSLQEKIEAFLSPENIFQDAYLASKITKDLSLPIKELLFHPTLQKWEISASTLETIAKNSSHFEYQADDSIENGSICLRINRKRNTLIFRHLPDSLVEAELHALLLSSLMLKTDDAIVCIRNMPSNTWFVEFSDETNIYELMTWLRSQTLEDVPIDVGIKSNHLVARLLYLHDHYHPTKELLSSFTRPMRRDWSPSSYSTQPTSHSNSDSASLPPHTKFSPSTETSQSLKSTPVSASQCYPSPGQEAWQSPTLPLPGHELPFYPLKDSYPEGYASFSCSMIPSVHHPFFQVCRDIPPTYAYTGGCPYISPRGYSEKGRPPYPFGPSEAAPVESYYFSPYNRRDWEGIAPPSMHLWPPYSIGYPFFYVPARHASPYPPPMPFGGHFSRGKNKRHPSRCSIPKAPPQPANPSSVVPQQEVKTMPMKDASETLIDFETAILASTVTQGGPLLMDSSRGKDGTACWMAKEAINSLKRGEPMAMADAPHGIKSLQEFPSLATAVTMSSLQKRSNPRRG
ncbi:hypothetical protein IE077_003823 [Cardiosporidium cionae]|uniref:Uncharacterized protein n=1 Tax=Cardiosporidium cionae TaxID=476202 RepID=A0ABQ7J7E4_9APIC|nr:hypothetical protein IE077_003823 [Cardiosporidium cionae]|eukprot:KAF8819900.1 hypothetical protein IE077_003823 [Cardiosporidium cionae]